jgi:hypothetical protein
MYRNMWVKEPMYFPSKRDSWLTAMLGMAAIMEIGVLLVLLPLDRLIFGMTLALNVAVGASVLWVWLGTGYTLTERGLAVRSGPLRWAVDYDTITAVRRTHNSLSAPALSLDRLEVVHGRGARLLVSPRDAARFLEELRRRCPGAAFP